MIEIPESQTIARQIRETLAGRVVTDVFNATHPHKFAWYSGDPLEYPKLLSGRKIVGAVGRGAFIDVLLEEDLHLAVSDGVNLRLYGAQDPIPAKYQLLMTLDEGRFLSLTVAMYGGIHAFRDDLDNPYYQCARTKCSPLEERFDAACFARLRASVKQNLSVKAFLATEQRIPGLGNGVLQDILFRAGIHPKRKLATLGDADAERLFTTLKSLLREMTDRGGRNTEKDLFGRPGGYAVRLSCNTCAEPCPRCGGPIVKEAYLGGAVYYCPHCQPIV